MGNKTGDLDCSQTRERHGDHSREVGLYSVREGIHRHFLSLRVSRPPFEALSYAAVGRMV